MQPTRQRPWRPLLDGVLRERARAAVDEIAATLRGMTFSPKEACHLEGNFGGALLLEAYRALADPGGDHAAAASARLDAALEALADVPLGPSLFSGFSGVAWAAQHLVGRLVEDTGEDGHAEIDEALLGQLESDEPWRADYDLVNGLVGLGVYALERLPHPSGMRCLAGVVRRLDETAERRDAGITWKTAPELLVPAARRLHPDGYYNLGVAHGVPGAIGLLAGAAAAGVARARPLLDGAVAWLFAQEQPHGPAAFAHQAGDALPARSAWCYGDPGIACTLLAAARAVGEPTWESHAISLGRRAAARPVEDCGVRDHGLCHGSAGLALLYHRLFVATEDPVFAAAARDWYGRTLDGRKPGEPVAGYPALLPRDGTFQWTADAGLLTGAAGVGLALLAGCSAVEPAWDRMLLASLPPA